ncbi:MAG: hypothetical protein KAW39_03700, partial [Thermoplasmata archaeon]|nr:hypothetical protein [Thermoplasmata archaeon]
MARTQSAVPERMQKSILHGPIVRTLLVLGWPIMLTNVFQMLYNLVDTYWLGKVSVEAVAAANLAWPLVFLFVSVA